MAVRYEILLLEPIHFITHSFLSAQHFGLILNKTDESVSQIRPKRLQMRIYLNEVVWNIKGKKTMNFTFISV